MLARRSLGIPIHMYQILNNKSVKGPDFVVTVRGIHNVDYVESGKTATIEIEGGTPEPGQIEWLIYAQTLRSWASPHDSERLDTAKRNEILENVRKSLSMLAMPSKIIW